MTTPLPEGEVFFLFTDLEGSTRLLERDAAGTGRALARHHELLAEAVMTNGGVVFETVGDAVYAAFAEPRDALAAAFGGQRALAAEDWGAIGSLRARMAIHGGPVERVGEHYFGPALFRCARLQALGHGGQTLVSQAVVERLGDALPPGATLEALGSHRLKDLSEPERVYQLSAPDLPSDFPPLRSLGGRPNNLPVQPTSFIGRQREMGEIGSLLAASRLVTLMGPGGTGKTRLALQVAADVIERYPDGVFLVPLATVTQAADVLPTVASTLAIHDVPGESALETLTYALRDQTKLLVLDNLEQIPEAGPEVAAMLAALPSVTILVTSRVALGVQVEQRWSVPPMGLPPRSTRLDLEDLAGSEAVQLFLARARVVRHEFKVTQTNAADVVAVCDRLDGLPLAIELAAARTNVFDVPDLRTRLEHRLALLTGGGRDRPERHRTLRSTIAWSWDLLAPSEQALAAVLAVFVGGCTLDAAEAICADMPDVPDPLADATVLVDASLLQLSTTADGGPRFTMLETIREFAIERLAARPDVADLRRRHALWVAALVERAELRGPDMPLWLQRFEVEHDNIRAALDWSTTHADVELAQRMVAGLWKFWWQRGYTVEGQRWADAALALSRDLPDEEAGAALAGTLNTAGVMIFEGGDDVGGAIPLLRRAVSIYRRTGPPSSLAETMSNLGVALYEAGMFDESMVQAREALGLARDLGDAHETIICLANLAEYSIQHGDFEQAERLAREAHDLAAKDGDPETVIASRITLADALVRGTDLDEAAHVLALTFQDLPDLRSQWHSAVALVVAARFFERSGRTDLATRSLAGSEAWIRATRSRIQRDIELEVAQIRQALISDLGQKRFEAAYAEGAEVELDHAVAEAADALRDLAAATDVPTSRA